MEVGSISDPLYNGCFSAQDSTVVNINYGLGPHGYLALPDAGIYGNYGTQDIILGLRWIQDNIAFLGGDRTKVLLFGQSAGAANSYVISTLSEAPSLIAGTAILSGGGRNIAALEDVRAWNEEFATRLNCSASDAACLRAVSPDFMNRTMAAMSANIHAPGAQSRAEYHGKGARWAPVVDGILVSEQPGAIGSKVPAFISSVAQDGRMFSLTRMETVLPQLTTLTITTFSPLTLDPWLTISTRPILLSCWDLDHGTTGSECFEGVLGHYKGSHKL